MALGSRIGTGWRLAGRSAGVLRRNPRLAVFPLTSGVATAVFVATAFGAAGVTGAFDSDGGVVAVVVGLYVGTAFLVAFCNAALTWAARETFRGQSPSVGAAFRAASRHLPSLFAWAIVSAVVGITLRAIEESSEIGGAMVTALVSLGWTALTYFVVPVVVFEDAGPRSMFEESGRLLRETWGETVGAELGLGVVTFLLALPGVVLTIGMLVAFPDGNGVLLALAVGGGLTLVGFVVGTALEGVAKTALYRYAREESVADGFDESLFDGVGAESR
ncbi:DUF6159 family protein [Halomicrococcus gelatinilyticus]|uniref:DUF6159 family protein n=1 Tax=Halomicrococcus gelatinilyticus TaxID=1702103 RepID=UPI002E0DC3E3